MNPPSSELITRIVREVLPGASAAWLFGSADKGYWREGSDLDLAVSMPQPFSAAARFQAAERMISALGVEVDLLDFHHLHTVMQVQIIHTGRLNEFFPRCAGRRVGPEGGPHRPMRGARARRAPTFGRFPA